MARDYLFSRHPHGGRGRGGRRCIIAGQIAPSCFARRTLRAPRMIPPSGEVNAIVQCIAFERARFRK